MTIAQLRKEYHQAICAQILSAPGGIPNIADRRSKASRAIALRLIEHLGFPLVQDSPPGQSAGRVFENLTSDFLSRAFALLAHLRPGKWHFAVSQSISDFEQYEHLAQVQRILQTNPDLTTALGGDYLVTPDIVVGRAPVSDLEINREAKILDDEDGLCRLTPLRERNRGTACLILHASISCKWTIRSDRAQNVRTEALKLIRNRKGRVPHILVVTAEPLPTRLASLALGTGDLDCVYHLALPELQKAVEEAEAEEQLDMLQAMIVGRRLRDVSDLPFDLAM